MMFLLNPAWANRFAESEKNNAKRLGKNPTEWDEDKTKFANTLVLNGKTYSPHKLFDSPLWNTEFDSDSVREALKKFGVACPGGKFVYVNRVLPAYTDLNIHYGIKRSGKVWFTTDVVIPSLWEVTPSVRVWMSHTPNEMMTQRRGITLATGRVVVGGLGLGWFLKKVDAKKSVKEIVLVEKDANLLKWLKPEVIKTLTDKGRKVTWVCDDVYEFMKKDEPNHDRTKYLLDIWPDYNATDHTFDAWKLKLGNRLWGWGIYEQPMRRLW